MDKFGHEKLNRRDIVLGLGGEPVWMGIKSGDEYLSDKEAADLSRRAVEVPARPSSAAVALPEQTIPLELSEESRQIFTKIFLFHPKTIISGYTPAEDGSIREVHLAGSDKTFFRDLLATLRRYDEKRLNFGGKG